MSFAHPIWLFLLVLVPIFGAVAILIAHLRGKRWKVFVADRLRGALLQRTSALPHWLSLAFLLLSLALMIIAIAGPRGDAGTSSEKILGRNVLFALDLSRSMRVSDVKPDRLAQAKVLIYEMMDAMPNDRMGLIGFAGNPYLFAPLTIDHGAVRETVEQLDETWIPSGGSDIVAALKLSIETLKKTGIRNNALVLISDGEKHDGRLDEVLRQAENSGVYIFTVGVGTVEGDFVPHEEFPDNKFRDKDGQLIISRLHPEVLKTIAEETKGRFAVAGSGVDIPALARSAMADLDQFELKGREKKVVVEFYQWLLGPALFCLLVSILTATRWRPIATRAAIAATVASSAPVASGVSPDEARAALVEGLSSEAMSEFESLAKSAKRPEDSARYRLGEASSAYQSKDFKKATDAYSGALLSDDPAVARHAHLGLGNALFHQGWQSLSNGEPYPDPPPADLETFDAMVREELMKWIQSEPPDAGETESFTRFDHLVVNWVDAVRHYDSALKLDPSDEDARQNRALAAKYLKRLKELLNQESDSAQQAIPQEPEKGEGSPDQEGEGEPKEGEPKDKGDPKDADKGQEGDQGDKKDQGQGSEGEPKDKGSGGDQDQPKDGEGKEGEKPPKPTKGKPDETPRERALRILGENQDVQKGPLAPGRNEFMRPEKDW